MATSREQEQLELLARIYGAPTIPKPPNTLERPTLDRFELFMLPPELRLLIYEYAVVDSKPKIFIRQGDNDKSWAPLQQPAITKTCREVRQETLKLFYANTFEFHDPNVTIDCLYRDIRSGLRPRKVVRSMDPGSVPFRDVFGWVKRIGKHNVAKIKSLRIQLTPRNFFDDDDNRAVALSQIGTARAEIQDVLLQYSRHAGFALPAEIMLGRHERHPDLHEQTGYKTLTLEFSAGANPTLSLRAMRLRSVVLRWKMFRWRVLRLGLCPFPRGIPKLAALDVVSIRGPWMARR